MTNLTFEQGDKDALAFIDTEDIIKHLEGLGYQVIDKSERGVVIENEPVRNMVKMDTLKETINALQVAQETTDEALGEHLERFGEETKKNKGVADMYRGEIQQIKKVLSLLEEETGL